MPIRLTLGLVATAILVAPQSQAQGLGGGAPWFGFGPVDTVYVFTLDTTVAFAGRGSLMLRSLSGADSTTWIASHQIVDARAYRGKRVRIRAHLRTEDASAAGMWVVVDGVANGQPVTLLSDSLTPRLRGTTHWREVSMVFDVPVQAGCIRYGSSLHGTGALWLDEITFAAVPSTTRVTLQPMTPRRLEFAGNCEGMVARPTNLGFEEAP